MAANPQGFEGGFIRRGFARAKPYMIQCSQRESGRIPKGNAVSLGFRQEAFEVIIPHFTRFANLTGKINHDRHDIHNCRRPDRRRVKEQQSRPFRSPRAGKASRQPHRRIEEQKPPKA